MMKPKSIKFGSAENAEFVSLVPIHFHNFIFKYLRIVL